VNEKKILVVDDEAPVRDVLKYLFQRSGYRVLTAENGKKAKEILSQQDVMVMFLDLHLPDANGLELCRQLRENNPDCAIFALTGYTGDSDNIEFRDAGFDDVFTKPTDCKMLLKAAEDAFDKIIKW